MTSKEKGLVLPGVSFGLGGVSIGNEFDYVTEDEAQATLSAAWESGIRYFDTAPWYGLGLCERRYGAFLHTKKRSDYVLSSKVGKLLKASPRNKGRQYYPMSPSPNDVVFDYTADGVKRSIEDSLQRMGVDSLDIVFVHDISSDNPWLPTKWEEQFEIARKGAFPTLSKMRAEGMIKHWGLGVNTPEPILRLIETADADVCLLARQYSLIDHQVALDTVFPAARKAGMRFVIGTALNAGFLSGRPRYNYGAESHLIPKEILAKRAALNEAAAKHGVDLRTAAIRFSQAPDLAAALIVGARSADQILADATSTKAKIPPDFWSDLKQQGLIAKHAPVPQDP